MGQNYGIPCKYVWQPRTDPNLGEPNRARSLAPRPWFSKSQGEPGGWSRRRWSNFSLVFSIFLAYHSYCYHIVATWRPPPMSKAKVTMLARINSRKDKFPYVPVRFKRNAVQFPITWERALGSHNFEADQVMGFYARFQNNGVVPKESLNKRLMLPLGKDPVSAYMEFQRLDQDFERIERGLAPVNVPADTPNPTPKMTLAQAIAKFERDLTAEGKKRRAVESYIGRARNFLRFFTKRPEIQLDRITADDIRNFLVWLPTNIRRRPGSGGHINNTQRNHLRDAEAEVLHRLRQGVAGGNKARSSR